MFVGVCNCIVGMGQMVRCGEEGNKYQSINYYYYYYYSFDEFVIPMI
jgi:hypothetical protein